MVDMDTITWLLESGLIAITGTWKMQRPNIDLSSLYIENSLMNKTYFGLALITLLTLVSAPLSAEVFTASTIAPQQIALPAKTAEEHQQAADIQKQHADHHKAMAEYDKSLAREYKNFGNH